MYLAYTLHSCPVARTIVDKDVVVVMDVIRNIL